MTVVSESGLYSVILRSDKPEAKKFKRWVTHGVLPSIRKVGFYATPDAARKKGGDVPLVDSGQMVQSVHHVAVPKGTGE